MLRQIFNSALFRGPQLAAAALLLIYLLQCVWLVQVQTMQAVVPDSDQALRTYQGLQQWRGGPIAGTPDSLRSEAATGLPSTSRMDHLRVRDGFDEDRSPLYYIVPAVPMLLRPNSWLPEVLHPLLASSASLFFGLMLGASLWYVARRLYGNAGGYIVLSLYCFSPAIIVNTAGMQSSGEIGGMWGAFGTVFTAIAVSHTLYAPREVVLWNWRRILLLGLSLALTTGNQFSLGLLALVILPLMLWVAPVRPRAVFVIWGAAIATGFTILFGAYFFEPRLLTQGMLHARWIDFHPTALAMSAAYRNAFQTIVAGSPPLLIAVPTVLATYAVWKRTRYFGNTAPFAISMLLLVLALGAPDFPGHGFYLTALLFLFVFVSGVLADLMETQARIFVVAAVVGLLGTAAIRNLWLLLLLR